MLRFLLKPRWLLLTLVIVAASVLMARLGIWQLHRLEQRRDFNTLVGGRLSADPQPLDPAWIGPSVDLDDAEWRIVTVIGTYGLETATYPAPSSYQLISTLTTTDGRSLVVNRGSIPVTADLPSIPQGEVTLVARVRRTPKGVDGAGSTTYLEVITADPDDAAGVTPLPGPELTEGPHLSYAIQWFAFSACAVVGWLLLVRRAARSRRTGLAGLRPSQRAVPWRD